MTTEQPAAAPPVARPYVLLSCAASLDGHIDDAGPERLVLSNEEDLDRVDAVRATCDAILVGATTVRRDDPRLLVRDEGRRAERVAAGRPANPAKVTLSSSGRLDPGARFFTTGGPVARLVYCPTSRVATAAARLGGVAEVVAAGDPLDLGRVLADLVGRGVRRLMVEGGGGVHTQFLAAGLVDEIHLVLAPFLVGQADAPRFVRPAAFPQGPARPMRLVETRTMGDCVLLRYRPQTGHRDRD
ncbi:RibD family protein [Streptomyces sp. 4N509B]|uniref:RibD family protein n=1 Tax=Streptomyces sp. 4N509B TaxID=3457413 RepID=UPI003FD19ABF